MMPQSIYCPKCGQKVEKTGIAEVDVVANVIAQGYSEACRYICPCGIVAICLKQELPKSPTFSLLFDIVKVEVRR